MTTAYDLESGGRLLTLRFAVSAVLAVAAVVAVVAVVALVAVVAFRPKAAPE